MKLSKKNKNQSDQSDEDHSQNSDQLNTDNSPKYIPIAKLGDKLKTKRIIINVSDTQYPIVQQVAQQMGWIVQNQIGLGDWDVWWTDRQINPDGLFRMHMHQKINHYPGIYVLARKNMLGLHLMGMKQRFPQQYSFFPQTWIIPLQFPKFRQFYQNIPSGKTRTYIVKPEALSQGKGIFLTRNIDQIATGHKYVVQRYIKDPFLIDGLKFDLRIYVLIAGTQPMRLYIFQQGLTRFATQKYEPPNDMNLNQNFVHLTNYSLNKSNPNYIYNTSDKEMDKGHKRTLTSTYEKLKKMGYNVDKLKQQIQDSIVKTALTGLPLISHYYRWSQPQDYQSNMCFHILGFDVMIKQDLTPIVIQVNHTPSFQTGTPLDYIIKKKLIKDTLTLLRITEKNKKNLFDKSKVIMKKRLETGKRQIYKGQQRDIEIQKAQKARDLAEEQLLGGYKKIHPSQDPIKQQKYDKFIEVAKIVEKQTHQTRKRILKQEKQSNKEKKVKDKNQSQGVSPKKINVQVTQKNKQKNILNTTFRTKITKRRHNQVSIYDETSLNKFNLMMQKAAKIDAQEQMLRQENPSIMPNVIHMKDIFMTKKHSFSQNPRDNLNTQQQSKKIKGAYLTPKTYNLVKKTLQQQRNVRNYKQVNQQNYQNNNIWPQNKNSSKIRKLSIY